MSDAKKKGKEDCDSRGEYSAETDHGASYALKRGPASNLERSSRGNLQSARWQRGLSEARLVDARDQAICDFAIGNVLLAEGLDQRRFFDVDAVKDSGGGWQEDNPQTEPIAGMQTDGKKG